MSASEKIEFSKSVNVKYNVDVFIAGGGPSGLAAGITAARHGASVFIAEAHSCFGGMGTAGLVPWFCHLKDSVNFLADGIGREVHDSMKAEMGSTWMIDPEVLKRIYDRMVKNSGADFSFYTKLVDVVKEGQFIKYAICSAKSGVFAVKAKLFIDCTGDGDLSAMAGAEYKKGDENGTMMPVTLCSQWCNIDPSIQDSDNVDWAKRVDQHGPLQKAIDDGVFSQPDLHLPGMVFPGHGIGGANIGHVFDVDGTDERSITRGLIDGRKLALEYEAYYKNYIKGFKDIHLVATASLLGVRETRRIMGDYILDLNDFKKRACFEDEIGRFSYPVDIHPPKADKESFKKFEEEFHSLRYAHGESYGIPYRSLTVKGFDNLFVAGRCVSTDRYMQSSIRVMPGCFITGQAVGLASALASKGKGVTREVNVKELQTALRKMGAFLP